jgi:hypothetical protein
VYYARGAPRGGCRQKSLAPGLMVVATARGAARGRMGLATALLCRLAPSRCGLAFGHPLPRAAVPQGVTPPRMMGLSMGRTLACSHNARVSADFAA